MSISPIQRPIAPNIELSSVEPSGKSPQVELGKAFAEALHEASALEASSMQSAEFAAGDPSVGIHEVMIASEKANIALRYATTLKNKALDAYRELMSTQV
jgi:flagellar hook-basal body complex protein FliE